MSGRRRAAYFWKNVAFVPLAMPIMFGPGAIATLISVASTSLHALCYAAWRAHPAISIG